MEHKTGCLICGNELIYYRKAFEAACFYCGKPFTANEKCKDDHFVCDGCHCAGAMDLIENYTIQTDLTDPLEMAVYLMKNPNIKMHGPEHHFLVPAVLLASHFNSADDKEKKSAAIKTARKRGEKVPGGFCGLHGACGAGIGVGIFVSILTGATPVSTNEWKSSNFATAKALEAIAECGGPRCCKRDTFIALFTAQEFIKNRFNITIEINKEIKCDFYKLNNECLFRECQFFDV